jgi:hypothetical protein
MRPEAGFSPDLTEPTKAAQLMIAVFTQLSGLSQLMSGPKRRPLATPFISMYQKREFETNPTQLSQLSGVVILSRQATWTQFQPM